MLWRPQAEAAKGPGAPGLQALTGARNAMQPSTRSIFDLFDGKKRYLMPLFQRQYVWTREEQWQPLWEDMERKLSDLASLRNQELLARLHPEERAAFARLWATWRPWSARPARTGSRTASAGPLGLRLPTALTGSRRGGPWRANWPL